MSRKKLTTPFYCSKVPCMAEKDKKATVYLAPEDERLLDRLKIRTHIFKTSDLFKHALRELAKNGKKK